MAVSITCTVSQEACFWCFGTGEILEFIDVISLVADGRIVADRFSMTFHTAQVTASSGLVHMILMVVGVQEFTDRGRITVTSGTT